MGGRSWLIRSEFPPDKQTYLVSTGSERCTLTVRKFETARKTDKVKEVKPTNPNWATLARVATGGDSCVEKTPVQRWSESTEIRAQWQRR
eukprot:590808-Amphidinium_carterae.1